MNVFELMLLPFIECLILVGIHSYLGLHVIRRRVIFVDLALAQIAALGTTVGVVFGMMPDTTAALVFSLTFCLLGAALFTFTRVRHDRIPHEAVIGLVYAITASLAILVVQKSRGTEHLDSILVGSLLWVKWSDIIAAAIAYSLIGGFHLLFWRRFLSISEDPEQAYQNGVNVRLWDFLFYASFGFVITFSTRVAGVLLVFVFLVAPAIMAAMITKRFGKQLVVGWASGTVVAVMGLYLSYRVDLPCGPTVVAFYGVMLALAAVVVYIAKAPVKSRAIVATVLGLAIVCLVGVGVVFEGRLLAKTGQEDRSHDFAAGYNRVLQAESGVVRSSGPGHGPVPKNAASAQEPVVNAEQDLTVLLETTSAQLEVNRVDGLHRLATLLEREEMPFYFCEEVVTLLKSHTKSDFGLSCEEFAATRTKARTEFGSWLERDTKKPM